MTSAPPILAGVDGPPNTPAKWELHDAELATQVALDPGERVPYAGAPPCPCGGAWRYTLRETATRRLWRCLHCGALHQQRRGA